MAAAEANPAPHTKASAPVKPGATRNAKSAMKSAVKPDAPMASAVSARLIAKTLLSPIRLPMGAATSAPMR